MVKQAIKTCICGQAVDFPEGEVKYICRCGAVWELGEEGYWFTEMALAPKATKPVDILPRSEKYAAYPKSKPKSKRKKGRRC
ncbi:hypothetical protein [Desulfosporosinus sp.]|uniref:hypothetical protein n=1 Tax=Desulfosporosinus sp. TaxID=157907 RepID=UPI0025BD25BF|nr:hypothetical protein [Desulfosporosinus sp.]MBC2721814.1 hypothetical protein [Desulfosporosinus sp.]MBC2726282.1 hypothetical protein [Desulfosporosinus sp.]